MYNRNFIHTLPGLCSEICSSHLNFTWFFTIYTVKTHRNSLVQCSFVPSCTVRNIWVPTGWGFIGLWWYLGPYSYLVFPDQVSLTILGVMLGVVVPSWSLMVGCVSSVLFPVCWHVNLIRLAWWNSSPEKKLQSPSHGAKAKKTN